MKWIKAGAKMFEVVYYSMCGNTKKVAEAIAAELDVKAENVKAKQELTKDSFIYLAHLTQTGSNKLVSGNGQMSVNQYIEEVKDWLNSFTS
ncbi:unnamed protein product, partial [marine sediment metagenome]